LTTAENFDQKSEHLGYVPAPDIKLRFSSIDKSTCLIQMLGEETFRVDQQHKAML